MGITFLPGTAAAQTVSVDTQLEFDNALTNYAGGGAVDQIDVGGVPGSLITTPVSPNLYGGANGALAINFDATSFTVDNDLTLGALGMLNFTAASGDSPDRLSLVVNSGALLTIEDGASVSFNGNGRLNLGVGAGTEGSGLMTGGSVTLGNAGSYSGFNIGYTGTGDFTQTGGTVELSGSAFQVGVDGGIGEYNMSGGSFTLTPGSTVYFGHGTGGEGTLNITGNAQFTTPDVVSGSGTQFFIGTNEGTGKIVQDGAGSLVSIDAGTNAFVFGYSDTVGVDGGVGSYELHAGTFEYAGTLGLVFGSSAGGTGTFTQTGGSFTADGPVVIGGNGAGTYTLSGGSAVMNGVLRIGYGTGSGAVVQSGSATAEVDGGIVFGVGSTSASYTLTGGSLTLAGGISGGNATSSFVFNGGTLIAASSFTAGTGFGTSFSAASTVQVDDADNVTWNSPISGAGNLTKTGTGMLTFGGNNASYTGDVALEGGTLALTALPGLTAQNDVDVGAGTTLDISDVPRVSGNAAPVQIGELSGSGTINVGNNALVTNIAGGQSAAFSGTLIATNHSWDSDGLDSSLVKYGAGTLVIDDMTAEIGNVYVAQGTLSQTALGETNIAYMAVGSNTAAVSGNLSTLNVSGGELNISEALQVGDWGGYGWVDQSAGTVTVQASCGDTSHCASLNIGNQGGTGVYTITGGELALVGGLHAIGNNSSQTGGGGTLNIEGGLVSVSPAEAPYGNGSLIIGDRVEGGATDATGILNQTGGTLHIAASSSLFLGGYGAGVYNLNGGVLEIGGNSLRGLYSGGGGTGSYEFNLGGGVIQVIGTALTTAVNAELTDGTSSTIDTNGLGATWSGAISGTGSLIKAGAGTLTLSGVNNYEGGTTINGGTVSVASSANLGTGGLILDGGTLATTGDVTTEQAVTLLAGGGTFNVADDTTLEIIGDYSVITGAGGLTKEGDGTLSLAFSNFDGETAYSGVTNVNAGTLLAATDAGLSSLSAYHVAGGATLSIGSVGNAVWGAEIGSLADGTVGGVTSGGEVYIEDGGLLYVGLDNTSTTFSGTFSGSGELSKEGTGMLTLTGGTRADSSLLGALTVCGCDGGESGVTLQGGSLDVTSFAGVFVDTATLSITQGGRLQETMGFGGVVFQGGIGNVTGTDALGVGSELVVTGELWLKGYYIDPPGIDVNSTLTVADGGILTANGGVLIDEGSELRIGSGNLAGTVTSTTPGALDIENNGTISANFTDSTTLDATLTGSGAFTKAGSGSLTYSGDGSGFTGTTTVQGGLLSVNDTLAGTIAVQTGGTLGGTGSVGATTVGSGGILAPGNSPGTLTLASLDLNTGARLDFELGDPEDSATSDHIVVDGDLALRGVLDVTAVADFGEGTYELIGYDTMSVNGGLLIGLAPGGYNYTVDTDTDGEVSLVVDRNGLQFWNGSHTSADGTVYGGSGTWNAGSTNWTNAAGTLPSSWNSMTAVFGGLSGGTVTVDGTVSATGLQFTTTGYTLTGGTIDISQPLTGLLADTGVTATIASTITGAGGLVKQGGGTVVLSGTNGYTGGTQILAGTLQVSANANLGALSGGLTLNGGTLATTGSFSTARDVTLVGAGTFAVAGGTTLGLTGDVEGAGGLVKQGAGTLALSGTNGYQGGTTLAAGTVQVAADASLGTGGLTFTGGTLATTASFDTSRAVTLTGNGTFAVANGTTLGLTGLVTGAGGLVKQGQGTLVLGGTVNDYTGGTDVLAGTLRVGAAGALPQFTDAMIAAGATLDLNGYGAMFGSLQGSGTLAFGTGGATYLYSGGTFAGAFTGGDVPTAFIYADADPAGTLTLSGNSSFIGYLVANSGHIVSTGNSSFGGLSLDGGTFEVAGGNTILDSYVYADGVGPSPEISVTGGGALTITQGLYIAAYEGNVGAVLVSGAGSRLNVDEELMVSYEGTGTLTLTGGTLSVTAGGAPGTVELAGAPTGIGTLNIGAASGSAPGAPGVVNAAQVSTTGGTGTVVFNHTGTAYYFTSTGTADGAPVVITEKTGEDYDTGQTSVLQTAGFTYLVGDNAYTGMTTVKGGTLSIGDGGTSGSIVGPATIAAGGTLQFARADDVIYAGTLAGTGALIKAGAGELDYTGDGSAFTGTTTVASGLLSVNGSLGGPVNVLSGGTLGGNGAMGSVSIGSGGIAAPGNSIGTLHVNGDVTFASGSFYEVELAGNGTSDLIAATGQAILNGGTVELTAIDPQTSYQNGQSYTILTAQGGIVGGFDAAVSESIFLDVTLDDLLNGVGITIEVKGDGPTPAPFTAAAITRNQFATASALDTLPQVGPELGLYNALLFLSSGTEARAAFDQLSGDAHASAKGLFVEESSLIRNALTDRLRAAQGGVGASNAPVVSYAPATGGALGYAPSASATSEAGMALKAVAAPATTEAFALWSTGFGSWAEMNGNGNAAGIEGDTGGFLIGADAPLAGGWRLGVAGGYSYSDFSVSGRSASGNSDNWHVGVYAGNRWGDLALRTGLAYTWQDVSTSRSVSFTGYADQLKADYDAGTFQAFGELGYSFDTAFAAFEPYVNLAYIRLHTDGYGEQGGAAALTAAGSDMDTSFTTLGLRASKEIVLGNFDATLRGAVGWRHAFGDVTPLTTQAFLGSDSFTVAGVPIAENAAVLEAGLDVLIGPSTTLGVAYAGQFGDDVTQNGFNATLKVNF